MKHVAIGKYTIPSWVLGVTLASICVGASALYMVLTFTIPFEVKEPIEILYYPSQVSLYPGDTLYFNVTIWNNASQNYTVFLDFSLDNAAYKNSYVTFSNATYFVRSGVQNLTAWLMVSDDAPPISTSLTVDVYRQTTTTIVQEESLFLTKQHVWYNISGSWPQAALVIINTGGRDVVLDKISVRGQECPWNNVYYWRTSNATVSNDLQVTPIPITGSSFDIVVQGEMRTFTQATDDLTLKSGWTIVTYIMNPDSIALNDVGITVGIAVFTANAQYYKETNVEAVQSGVRLFKLNVNFYTQNGTKIDIDVGNSGTSDTQIILLYTGTSSTTLQNQTTTPTLPAALRAGSTQRITINYDWTGGVTYYFKVVSSAGQTLEWPEQAPMGTEQLHISKITWTWSDTATARTFTINVNNTGTKDLTISQVLVNYAGVTGTITPALPLVLKATESTSLTVTYVYTNGTNYDISVATASNYKFTNTFSGGQDTG